MPRTETSFFRPACGVPSTSLTGATAGHEADQRVSLARALVLDPELLLLGEPFPGIDASGRVKLYEDLALLLAENHRTAVLVTHSLKEAARLGDKVAVMLAGQRRQVGSVRDIRARPVDEEVAGFGRDLRIRAF